MTNPWTKKNPLMSMWLSGANKVAGQARGHAKAEVEAEANKQTTALTQQAVRFWTGAWSATARPKPKR